MAVLCAGRTKWALGMGCVPGAHALPSPGETNGDHGVLETTVLHSTFLAVLWAGFQCVVILINSSHAKSLQGEEAHAQRFPEAAASHLDARLM